MIHITKLLMTLLICLSSGLLSAEPVHYGQNQHKNSTQPVNSNRIYGKVTETFNATGYTYAEVDTGKNKVWAAAPVTPLKVGDMISFSSGMPMTNFHSKSMNRDFPTLYFVSQFNSGNSNAAIQATNKMSPHAKMEQKPLAKPIKGIKKAKGGDTIAEIYTNKTKLNGKKIRVRGKVTKYSPSVMDKNWLHIRDSSTLQDLTITTNDTAAVNDIVIIEGKLNLDKDFGYGYIYPVIVQDATISNK